MSERTGHNAADHLDAHVSAVSNGLQALMDLLDAAPPDRMVRAGPLRSLIAPLADEASQAQPLARMLADQALAADEPPPAD